MINFCIFVSFNQDVPELRLKPSNYNLINSHNDIVTGGWASGDKAGYPPTGR